MGEHYRADRSATVFSRTIGLFGPRCSCGSVTELLTKDEHFRVCQRCDNRPVEVVARQTSRLARSKR